MTPRTPPAPAAPAARRRRALTTLMALATTVALAAPAAASAEIGWSPTVDVASAVDGAANQPDVAVDADGTAYAAFVRASSSGGPSLLQVARRPRGGAWSSPVTVSRAVGGEAGSRIAVAPKVDVRDGVVAVAWLQSTPDSALARMNQAWAAVRTADGRWNAPTALSAVPSPAPATSNAASDLAVAVGPGGVATLAFFQDGKNELVTREGGTDGTWSAATTVSPGSASIYAGYTDLVVAHDGAATLVWQDAPGDDPVVAVAERAPGATTWSDPVALSDGTRYSLYPKLAVADDGDADVVWQTRVLEDSAFAQYEVQLAHREGEAGEWSDVEVLSPPGGEVNNRGTAKGPAVSVAPDGDLSVAWVRSEGANADLIPDRVQVRTRAAAGGWGGVADVWSGLRNPTLRAASLATGPGGQATVAVSGYTTSVGAAAGPRSVRVVRRETPGGAWSTERELSVGRAGSSTAVSWEIPIAADPRGDVTLAWHQVDGTGETGVQSASYRASEDPVPPPAPQGPAEAAAPAPAEPAPAPAGPAAPSAPAVGPAVPAAAAALRLGVGWERTQGRRYAARNGVLVAFRGTPGATADVVVRRGGTVVARLRGVRVAKDGRLVRRVRLTVAGRRGVLRATGTVSLRVTATVAGRSRTGAVRLR